MSLLFYLVVYLGASIPEIVEKCDRFDPFPGAFAKYHGKREGDPVKKECEEQKKEQPRCHAKLCGLCWLLGLSVLKQEKK